MEISAVSDMTVHGNGSVAVAPPVHFQSGREASRPEEREPANAVQLEKMVNDIQKNLNDLDVSLTFSTYGKGNEKVSIVVAEKETGRIIREIPSKEMQALYNKMNELVGLIYNRTA
jgi:flagellar protein FlaG